MSDAARGCYVYCVIPSGERPPLAGLPGVGPAGGPVRLLAADGLSGVVSSVPLDEFGAQELERRFEDMAWLERTARAHQAVLDAVLAVEAMVPLRLCTIFRDEEHARQMLEREHDVLAGALSRVRGRVEWSVKVLADPQAMETAVRERSVQQAGPGASDEGSGRAYLARKRFARRASEDVRALAESAADEVHSALSELAAATTVLPPQDPRLSGRRGAMLLNGAYLVERARADEFRAAVDQQVARRRPLGLEVELSGPWAPYNFASPAEVGA